MSKTSTQDVTQLCPAEALADDTGFVHKASLVFATKAEAGSQPPRLPHRLYIQSPSTINPYAAFPTAKIKPIGAHQMQSAKRQCDVTQYMVNP